MRFALELEKTATPRPMTHDLLQNMARGLNAIVQKVVVVGAARGYVPCGDLDGPRQARRLALDARPSDAIALALRWDCPDLCEPYRVGAREAAASGTSTINADEMRRWLEI